MGPELIGRTIIDNVLGRRGQIISFPRADRVFVQWEDKHASEVTLAPGRFSIVERAS